MRIASTPPVHLTYCLNVHRGEAWAENEAAIRTMAVAVRDRVGAPGPFGLGLRLGNRASLELLEPGALEGLRRLLAEQRLYAFTVNGFPYGSFHGTRVKENVYAPDWRTAERVEYTARLADVLAQILPEGVTGSISTVPGSYKAWVAGPVDRARIAGNLAEAALHLSALRERTGREIHLGLEPEPDCLIETTAETVAFFERDLDGAGAAHLRSRGVASAAARAIIRRHVGVCFDTCHLAIQFEDLAAGVARLAAAGIRLSKVQISAALRAGAAARERLRDFCDAVYLHQVKVRGADGGIRGFGDLPDALAQAASARAEGEWRVHFHVPLYAAAYRGLETTAGELTPEFFRAALRAGAEHFEIETYTFDVLPDALKARGVVASVADEYAWVRARLDAAPGPE
jgi:sugar phosphate isomerase/epimerase